MLFDPSRHEPLGGPPWSEAAARDAIQAIVDDSVRRFDPLALWATHPGDVEPGEPDLPIAMLSCGAAGAIWALRWLHDHGAARFDADHEADFGEPIGTLAEHGRRFAEGAGWAPDAEPLSYFTGDAGILLLEWKSRHLPATADRLFAVVEANLHNPALEAHYGSAGTLVAALHMLEATHEARWKGLFREGVDVLWRRMHPARHRAHPDREVWLWTQRFGGHEAAYLGAAHGFAGNLYPVIRGAAWLDATVVDGFEARALQTLEAASCVEGDLVHWDPYFDDAASPPRKAPQKALVQDCHGAPGIICRLAGTRSPALRELLRRGGEGVWAAGPLNKSPCLCHGTDGNGYAFLKLRAMTGDPCWLDRARAFAMHAIGQSEALAAVHGQRRHTLWTGDLGLAVYLWSCIEADDRFPTLDMF